MEGVKWSERCIFSSLFPPALAAYAVTRAFCKELLCETFGYLLLPNDSPNNQPNRDSEVALQAFKLVLNLAKEATSCLLNAEGNEQHIRAVAGCSDSGEALLIKMCQSLFLFWWSRVYSYPMVGISWYCLLLLAVWQGQFSRRLLPQH